MRNESRAVEHIIVLLLGIQGFQPFNKQEKKGSISFVGHFCLGSKTEKLSVHG